MSSRGIKLNYLLGSGPGPVLVSSSTYLTYLKLLVDYNYQQGKGDTMKAIKVEGNYRLYKVEGNYELWFGTYTLDTASEKGVRVGYVSDPENFEDAVDVAKEELAYMMDEVC